MTALIILFAAVVPQQASQSLYSRIVQNPTGRNGYEEYVMAADRVIVGDLREAVDAIDIDDGESTRLARIKIVFDKSHDIARLITTGNRKSSYYPNAMNFETLLPELGQFRIVSRVLAARAEWQFSQGQPNEAIETTVDLMAFSEGVAGAGPVIHYLIGTAGKNNALGSLSKHRGRIALPGAADLQLFGQWALERPSPLLAALRTEYEGIIASMDGLLTNRELTGIAPELKKQLQEMSAVRWALIKDETVFALTQTYDARMAMMDQPESEWESIAEQIGTVAKLADPVAQLVFESILPMNMRIEKYELVRRAQFRLLVLHAGIIQYKWTHGKRTYGQLPDSLADLDVPISIIDPLTGEPFKYELVDDEYDLYSEGTPGTGRIDLNWRSTSSSNELMPPNLAMLSRASSSTTSATRLGTP
ncbi:MAG: hypothetical protein IH944_04000 [Armatimonadetes bacterium]|nr:hypothetical protein [Armatimonadota bacterium]